MTDSVTTFLAFLTLLGDILLVILALAYAFPYQFTKKIRHNANQLIHQYGLPFILLVSLSSLLGSLFFSEVALYAPCTLCWYQRIFMYPLAVLVLVSMRRKSKEVVHYILPLAIIGALIAAYNYIIQIQATLRPFDPAAPCSLNGTSCAVKYFFEFGYITIPLMALTAFLLIILISLVIKKGEK
ncbi:MAG: disulfide bond formation protein B [Patescibacteria group bacterium]